MRIAVLTLLVLVLCPTAGVHPQPAKTPALESRLRSEALARARNYWSAHTSNCGSSYIARSWFSDRSGGHIKQLTNVRFSLAPRQLTEADRLNGLEWDGFALANGTSERDRHFSALTANGPRYGPSGQTSPPEPWTQWQPSPRPAWSLRLVRTRGQWSVAPAQLAGSDFRDFDPWPCSDEAAAERVRREAEAVGQEKAKRAFDEAESRRRTKVVDTFEAFSDLDAHNPYQSSELTDVDALGFGLGGIVRIDLGQPQGWCSSTGACRTAAWDIDLEYHAPGENGWGGKPVCFRDKATRDRFVSELDAAIKEWRKKYYSLADVDYRGIK